MQNISALELAEKINSNILDGIIVDVREKDEFFYNAVEGSVNYPLSKINEFTDELKKHSKIYLICETGMRSSYACNFLTTLKINSVNVSGGIQELQDALVN